MARPKLVYLCTACGAEQSQWTGQCTVCSAWNSLERFTPSRAPEPPRAHSGGIRPGRPIPLVEVESIPEKRQSTGIHELDQVLGGGMVPGSAILLGGDPGIGKSTLLLEALVHLAPNLNALYVSGEESAQQIKLRADRLGVGASRLPILVETDPDAVCRMVAEEGVAVLAIDSIQTMIQADHPSAAGTVTQVRECASRLIRTAKHYNATLFLVSHVTKEGLIAGPRVLEHMVDTVLYFEGERTHNYRILRTVKNRFGPANEIGVFEMRDSGLKEVPNPSELFLSERVRGAAGAVVFAGVEGTRPVLVEIQALVAPSPLSQPRRTTLGVDANRLAMLIALLEKRLGLGLFDRDIFINAAGGFRITEPAADLAVAMAIFASHRNLAVNPGMVILGEIGLAGEIRMVAHLNARVREAAKLGFTHCMLPANSLKNLTDGMPITPVPVESLTEAAERLAQ